MRSLDTLRPTVTPPPLSGPSSSKGPESGDAPITRFTSPSGGGERTVVEITSLKQELTGTEVEGMRDAFTRTYGEDATKQAFRLIDSRVGEERPIRGEHVVSAQLAALEFVSPGAEGGRPEDSAPRTPSPSPAARSTRRSTPSTKRRRRPPRPRTLSWRWRPTEAGRPACARSARLPRPSCARPPKSSAAPRSASPGPRRRWKRPPNTCRSPTGRSTSRSTTARTASSWRARRNRPTGVWSWPSASSTRPTSAWRRPRTS